MTTTVTVPTPVHEATQVTVNAARSLVKAAAPVITTVEAGRGHLLTASDVDMLRVLDGLKALDAAVGKLDATTNAGEPS